MLKVSDEVSTGLESCPHWFLVVQFILEASLAMWLFESIGFKNLEAGSSGTEMTLGNELVFHRDAIFS